MMFDEVLSAYYEKNILFYEYGDGLSTSGKNVWSQRLHKDWNAANAIMLEHRKERDAFQKTYVRIIKRKRRIELLRNHNPIAGKIAVRLDRLSIPGIVGHVLYMRKSMQMTDTNISDNDMDFLEKCMKGYEEIK